MLDALKIITPETVIRWHRAGFRAYWRCKSRPLGGRPKTSAEIRQLVREMSLANPFWGAPRIHGDMGAQVLYRPSIKHTVAPRGLPAESESRLTYRVKKSSLHD